MAYYPVVAVFAAFVIVISGLYCLAQLIKLIVSVSRQSNVLSNNHLEKTGIAVAIFFIAVIVMNSITSAIFKKAEILLSDESVSVVVNGTQMPTHLVREFYSNYKERYWSKELAGSSPTSEYRVDITLDDKSMRFTFKRDSRNSELYWVYYSDLLINFKSVFVNTSTINQSIGKQ